MTTALTLFSGGLDSILACRVIMAQGIRVVALRFLTPFFDSDVAGQVAQYRNRVMAKYGIEVEVVDVSQSYITMLEHPAHGYGKHFNPCIDCKIFMLQQARQLMPRYGADFLVTGEVLGQRPMSQRRDTLHVIERDSGCAGMLLRPLSAHLLPPTQAEEKGFVERDRLLHISGRGRREQKALAREFGIHDYPTPAGGCKLADVNLTQRFKRFSPGIFATSQKEILVQDFRLLLIGRTFEPLPGYIFVVGRNEEDNLLLEKMKMPGDRLYCMVERSGPLGLLRRRDGAIQESAMLINIGRLDTLLAGIIIRYGKKVDGKAVTSLVHIEDETGSHEATYQPLAEELVRQYLV